MSESVLVLGRMFPPGTEEEAVLCTRRGMVSLAASAHLEKIINGLDLSFGADNVCILNVPPVSSYPLRYKKLFIKKRVWTHSDEQSTAVTAAGTKSAPSKNARDISIDFFNLTVLKNISIQHKLDKYALDAIKKNNIKYVAAYTVNEIFLKTCVKIKQSYPDIHICVIVPDLPEFTDLDKTGIKALLYKPIIKRRVKKTNELLEIADSFVFLTKQMADYFPVKRPYIVSEAIAPKAVPTAAEKPTNSVITAAYTGSFTKKYGIMELMDAISRVKARDVRFVIAGSGEMYSEVEKRALTDKRIVFRGTVTHAEALAIQQDADILINPRMNNEEYTKYSFPSKIMEYMSAGKTVVCFRLDGIPPEYDDYLTYFESADTMHLQLEALLAQSRSELAKNGQRAAEFVFKEKSCARFGQSIRGLMEKKRLLICSDDLCIGGTTTSLLSLLGILDKDKYCVDLITPNKSGALLDRVPSYVNVLAPAAQQSRLCRGISYLLRGYLIRRFFYRLTKLKIYPKGIFQLMSGIACTSVSRSTRRYYDAVIGYMEGFADHYAIKKTRAAKKLLYVHVNYKASGLDPQLDKDIFLRADGIAAVSADGAAALTELFPECAQKISVVENPVSPMLIRSLADNSIPEEDYAPRDCFNIVTTARLENAHKAIDRAVMAMARIKELCGVPVRWYVFGDGSDKEKIQALIFKNGAINEFFLMGARENVYPYIKKADLFVLPSRYEGKPLCVTEAQILGCVPTVTEYGSAKEQILNGIDGIICPNSDGAELADAIIKIINDRPALYEMQRMLSRRDFSAGADTFYKFLGI